MAESYQSAQIVKTASGKQYHIGCAPGDVADRIILVGDPARAEKVAARFDSVEVRRAHREYVTLTGVYKGNPMTVHATGIGVDNTEIAVIELVQCVEKPTMIRVGSSGALVEGIDLGDLVISTGSVRLESTSTQFVPEGYPAVAHHEVVLALIESGQALTDRRYHVGLTATACGFYGAQGRNVPGFPPRDPGRPARLGQLGVKNMEMEASLLFALGQVAGCRTGAVCAIYANRDADTFVDSDMKDAAEAAAIETGLGAMEVLRRMDAARGEEPLWRASHGLGEG